MKKTFLYLFFIVLISLFFNSYKKDVSPPGFNADEAAVGYNAYSILKTGKDEYGALLPLRLKSFEDYKMPLYSYLSTPFILIGGLSEDSTRALNTLVSALLPLSVFFLALELFKKKEVALISAFLVATSLGLNVVGRQAHEAYLAVFFLSLTALFFLKSFNAPNRRSLFLVFIFALLSLFSYQSSRILIAFFACFAGFFLLFKRENKLLFLAVVVALGAFLLTDLIYSPTRIKNLFITSSPGFSMKVTQLRDEGGFVGFYNKPAVAIRDVAYQHLKYFSPEFLLISGDENTRFGFEGMSPLTIIEYFFFFLGLYYLFKNREKWRYFLLLLVFISPLSASLSWAGTSLTRSLFILIPFLILASYGFYNLYLQFEKKRALVVGVFLLELVLLFYSWDFYLNHYPKRGLPILTWQAGYKEMISYVQEKQSKVDKIFITRKHGQPYIFYLFYTKYDPSAYQKKATISDPDEYGFGQVESIDSIKFIFPYDAKLKNVIWVGYPDDYQFLEKTVDFSKIKKIKGGNEEIFWIYET